MEKYTTGEVAKHCGISVRTVQYYDTRGILSPGETSEGGRRLYTETDLKTMEIICFLKRLGLPLESIRTLLKEENSQEVIFLLLEEQEAFLKKEIDEKQAQLSRIKEVKQTLSMIPDISSELLGDTARILMRKKQWNRLIRQMLFVGTFMDLLQIFTLLLWIFHGIWQPFLGAVLLMAGLGFFIGFSYYQNTVLLCPRCHQIFRPGFWESFFALHTPHTRKVTCKKCGKKGFCIETYGKE